MTEYSSAMISIWDTVFFLCTFFLVLGVGLYVGKEEKTAKDYFLGGKTLPWWGVAGSLFGTNISANHLVGMLGIGFSVGFAQSHYEFGSIFAILILAFVFLPVFRRNKFFTLSQFLEGRYGKTSALFYSLIVLILITIQLTSGLYIGARAFLPFLEQSFPSLTYEKLVVILALASTIYTWFGGLKSVVYTDVIQTVLILLSGLVLAYLTLTRPEVGGISGLLAKEAADLGTGRMSLYLPSDHPLLPWSGALSGLFLLHIFYWNTNQYVVQRTLGASSLREARKGILASGFLKLSVPFFSILTGVAGYHIWNHSGQAEGIDPDEAFSQLVLLIVPAGYGLVGVILAGLLGAIFSSIDSMLHSAATLFTIDFYLPFRRRWKQQGIEGKEDKQTEDEDSLKTGRWFLLFFSAFTTLLALLIHDPHSKKNFFLELSAQSSHFTPGILVVFLFGILWKKSEGRSAWITILMAPIVSFLLPVLYHSVGWESVYKIFGQDLNFLHRVFLVVIFSSLFHFFLSLFLSAKNRTQNLTSQNNRLSKKNKFYILLSFVYAAAIGILIVFKVSFPADNKTWAVLGFGITAILSGYISYRYSELFPKKFRRKIFCRRDEWRFGLLFALVISFYFYF
ncbi:SLC5 family protein [Leptospira idonii]|nr:sodium/solute symporter [Leptospira idonii]